MGDDHDDEQDYLAELIWGGRLSEFKDYVTKFCPDSGETRDTITSLALELGDTELLEWLRQSGKLTREEVIDSDFVAFAFEANNPDLLAYLRKSFNLNLEDKKLGPPLTVDGHMELIMIQLKKRQKLNEKQKWIFFKNKQNLLTNIHHNLL
jgi:hypothetical protein